MKYDFSRTSTEKLKVAVEDYQNEEGTECRGLICGMGCPFDSNGNCPLVDIRGMRYKLLKEELERRLEVNYGNGIPKRGDRVLVRDDVVGCKQEAIYLTTIEGSTYPIVVVSQAYEEEFKDGKLFQTEDWMCMSPLEDTPKEYSMQEIADKMGIKVADLRIKG